MAATMGHLRHLGVKVTSKVEDIGSVFFVQLEDPDGSGGPAGVRPGRGRGWQQDGPARRNHLSCGSVAFRLHGDGDPVPARSRTAEPPGGLRDRLSALPGRRDEITADDVGIVLVAYL